MAFPGGLEGTPRITTSHLATAVASDKLGLVRSDYWTGISFKHAAISVQKGPLTWVAFQQLGPAEVGLGSCRVLAIARKNGVLGRSNCGALLSTL